MKSYAYLDKYGILHIVDEEEMAKEDVGKSGKIVETVVPNRGGYPLAFVEEGMIEIVVYSLDEAYIDGNRSEGVKVDVADYPEIEELYKKLA